MFGLFIGIEESFFKFFVVGYQAVIFFLYYFLKKHENKFGNDNFIIVYLFYQTESNCITCYLQDEKAH